MNIPQAIDSDAAEHSNSPEFSRDDRPLRILVGADVPPDLNAGASGTVLQTNLALRELGHHVDEIWASDLGRRIRHGNLHYAFELPRAYRRELRRALRENTYDVIEFNQPHAWLAAADYRRRCGQGVFINRSHGHEIRYDLTITRPERSELSITHRMLSRLMRRKLWGHWHKVVEHCDGFIVSCQQDVDFLEEFHQIAPDRVAKITQGVPDTYLASPVQPMGEDRVRRVLTVGAFTPGKGPALVAQVATRILIEAPETTFTWVCETAYHARAMELIDPSVRARVTLLDWMPQSELMPLFDRHGMFLFPSLYEGFGKAPLEAMSRGMCVVTSDIGGMSDYIENEVNGLTTPVGDSATMSRLCLELLQKPNRIREFAAKAVVAAAHHTWSNTALATAAFYRECMVRKSNEKYSVKAIHRHG